MGNSFVDAYGRTVTENEDGSWTTEGITTGVCTQAQAMSVFNAHAPAGWVPPTPPPARALNIRQQARKAIQDGLTITLTGSVTMDATLFPTDTTTQAALSKVMQTVTTTGTFAGGATSFPMLAGGAWVPFTIAQYTTIAEAIDVYVTALTLIMNGYSGAPGSTVSLPSNEITLTLA